jgi:hypothetical protein
MEGARLIRSVFASLRSLGFAVMALALPALAACGALWSRHEHPGSEPPGRCLPESSDCNTDGDCCTFRCQNRVCELPPEGT